MLRSLRDDLRMHFKDSPYMKPAALTIQSVHRRYPLHESNVQLILQVEIHNTGEGTATAVEVELAEAIGPERVRATAAPSRHGTGLHCC